MPAPSNPSTAIDRDISVLHPIVREAVKQTLEVLHGEGFQFAVFEAYRLPQRQSYLFGQGRTRPGAIITQAKPWESYHQYGLAADIVLQVNGKWSWDASGEYIQAWDRLHQIGEKYGLEPLRFERPHLQFSGLGLSDLQAGKLPGGGDAAWWDNLSRAVTGWKGVPASPVL